MRPGGLHGCFINLFAIDALSEQRGALRRGCYNSGRFLVLAAMRERRESDGPTVIGLRHCAVPTR